MTYKTTTISKSIIFSTLLSLCYAPATFAQTEESKRSSVKIDSTKPLVVEYQTKAWNHSGSKTDSGVILFRDAQSGKLARIEVIETSENSDKFHGQYLISWGEGMMTPEIYIAPQKMLSDSTQMKQIETMIKDGQLLRKPIFVRFTGRNIQTISIFDTKEQALDAYEKFVKTGNVVLSGQLEAAQNAKRAAELQKERQLQAAEDLAKEKERLAMQEAEKKKQEEMKRQQSLLNEKEKLKRQQQAKALAEQAMALYNQQKYAEAEAKFIQSTELDPNNNSYNFQYGATLYRNEKYNKSLVMLDLANGPDVNNNEKLFFKGLNHIKLQEFAAAKTEFGQVKDSKDKQLSGTAAFYIGVIQFQKEELDEAKSNFEFVLDNSTDPKLDQQAESYIEQIANIMTFKENAKKKFILSASVGASYDSNILSTSNSQIASGDATDLAGYRMPYSLGFEYRPVYTENHEFSLQINYSDMYSLDDKFKSSATFQSQDPLSLNFKLPYKYKGIVLGKPTQLGLNVGYDTLKMNADGTGPRESISSSTYVSTENVFVMADDYFASYNLELRSDKALVDTTTDEDDSNASRISFTTSHTRFIDPKKTKANIYDFGYSMNNAKGENQKYQKIDLGYSFMNPVLTDSTLITKIGYYSQNYSEHLVGRKDANVGLTVTLSKPLNPATGLAVVANYNSNSSTLESSAYNKYSVMAVVNWTEGYALGSDNKSDAK